MKNSIVISASVVTDDPHFAALASDAFNRAANELALQGMDVSLTLTYPRDDEDDSEEDP